MYWPHCKEVLHRDAQVLCKHALHSSAGAAHGPLSCHARLFMERLNWKEINLSPQWHCNVAKNHRF